MKIVCPSVKNNQLRSQHKRLELSAGVFKDVQWNHDYPSYTALHSLILTFKIKQLKESELKGPITSLHCILFATHPLETLISSTVKCVNCTLWVFLFKLRHLITVWASAALTITDEVRNLNSCSYWGRDLHELNLNKNYLELKKKKHLRGDLQEINWKV